MKAIRITSIFSCSLVALTLVAAASVAQADEYTVGPVSTATTLTDFTGATADLAQFNSALGTLTSVQITLTGVGTTDINATSADTSNVTELETQLTLVLTDPTDANVNAVNETMFGSVPGLPLTVVNGTPYDSGSLNLTGSSVEQTLLSDLSSFIGSGDVEFDLSGAAQTLESFSGGNLTSGQTTDASGGVEITYFYNPGTPTVPEPGTLLLFGTGLLGMAFVLRRKYQQSL